MVKLYSENQVLELLQQQRINCNIAANLFEPLDILKAKVPVLPQPQYIVQDSIVKPNE